MENQINPDSALERTVGSLTASAIDMACSELDSLQRAESCSSQLDMEKQSDPNSALERTVSSLTASVIDMACSELDICQKAESCSFNTANEKEKSVFFKRIRDEEHTRLLANIHNKDGRQKELNVHCEISNGSDEGDLETEGALEEESLLEDKKTEVKKNVKLGITEEETASEEERERFFRSVRQNEQRNLVEASERENIRKEAYMKTERENKLAKEIEYFFSVDDNSSMIYLKKKEESKLPEIRYQSSSEDESNGHPHRVSPSISNSAIPVTIATPEIASVSFGMKIDVFNGKKNQLASSDRPASDVNLKRPNSFLALINRVTKKSKSFTEHKKEKLESKAKLDEYVVKHEESCKPKHREHDTSSLSDFDEPPRPRLKPFFPQQEVKVHETPEVTTEEPRAGKPSIVRRLCKWLRKHCCCCSVHVD